MDYLDAARRSPWVAVYLVAGVGVLINFLGEAYSNAADVCEMYPQFSFRETLLEELLMHHTPLPLVRVHVPTLHLLGAYVVAYAAKHWGLLPLLVDLLSGRWLYRFINFFFLVCRSCSVSLMCLNYCRKMKVEKWMTRKMTDTLMTFHHRLLWMMTRAMKRWRNWCR